jgi:hypothetical protein
MPGGFDFLSSELVVVGLVILAISIGILFVPLTLGIRLLRKAGQGELHRMAALLTLMPVLTEPLFWLFPVFLSSLIRTDSDAAHLSEALGGVFPGVALLSLIATLPSVVLTGLIALRFRRCLSGSTTRTAWFLLILAGVRWLNSFMTFAAPAFEIDGGAFMIIGIIMPTVFAIAASYASSKVSRARVERST